MMDELTSKDYYFDSYSHFGKSLSWIAHPLSVTGIDP